MTAAPRDSGGNSVTQYVTAELTWQHTPNWDKKNTIQIDMMLAGIINLIAENIYKKPSIS